MLSCVYRAAMTADKSWVSKTLKILLNKKRRAFRAGDLSELNLKNEIKSEIRRAELNYKLERDLSHNNLGSVWDGLNVIIGSKTPRCFLMVSHQNSWHRFLKNFLFEIWHP